MTIRPLKSTEWILRIPLPLKLVVANTAVLVVGVALMAWALAAPWGASETAGTFGTPGILLGIAVGTILLGAVVNTVVVRIALSPLRTLEETAIRVDAGRDDARAGTSVIADRDLHALMERFDGMLDSLGEARSRQQAAASRLVDSEERLRMRIAGQLYGDVGQRLAALLLTIVPAVRGNGSDPKADPVETLTNVQSEVGEVLEIIRGTARSLRPPELDDLGVMAAVQAEVRTIDDRSPVSVVLRAAPPDLPLEEHAALVLFRLIQEGLGVVLKESTPTGIDLTIRATDTSVRCEIEATRPDGEPSPRIGEGLPDGLLEPMRERAAWIRGHVSVAERAPGCPRLQIEIPASRDGRRSRASTLESPNGSSSPSFSFQKVRPA